MEVRAGAVNQKKRKADDDAVSPDDEIIWPPCIIVENTRLFKDTDGRWTGLGNVEMACFLAEIGHTMGRPKSCWGKEGHLGQVIIQYPSTIEGLKEAERLHEHFRSCNRGRTEWMRVKCMWHGLPGHEDIYEGPDLKRVDNECNKEKRVLYGYLAKVCDKNKLIPIKKLKKCETRTKKDIEPASASTQ
ncbi:hypothetical protein KP509_02G011000 [Ceratopteris richardii]|uniref:XS domain-containing protein n=1 Tax=Ceratopteris richardii TaxID=49495 RepID=A0A8T2VAJ9_CERRI|nr:hypothetical protein KP509_02G011000 [Ceratopteris richardii]